MISYAQNAEDIVLLRIFGDRDRGFYIDVGAADPRADSVTKLFYDRGWSGVNVEPQLAHIERLKSERVRDVNLHAALSDSPGRMPFFHVPEVPDWSTLSDDMAEWYRTLGKEVEPWEIDVLTLAEVCERYAPDRIDFLKIDVEGHEGQVLSGGDWKRYRPIVIVIEATKPERWDGVLENAGYTEVLFDAVNRFYLANEYAEYAEKLSSPANMVLDEFVPYVFHDQLEQAGANNRKALARISELEVELDQARGTNRAALERIKELESLLRRAQSTLQGMHIKTTCLEKELAEERTRHARPFRHVAECLWLKIRARLGRVALARALVRRVRG